MTALTVKNKQIFFEELALAHYLYPRTKSPTRSEPQGQPTPEMLLNKDRLYVTLHVRAGASVMSGKEDTYHWALMVGPKSSGTGKRSIRYHAKEQINPDRKRSEWIFEESENALDSSNMMLVRILVGKVVDGHRVVEILRSTPSRQGTPGWNCVGWVQEALQRLRADETALGRSSVVEWVVVRDEAMKYCERKKEEHRFDGKGGFDMRVIPTYDLIRGKEVVR